MTNPTLLRCGAVALCAVAMSSCHGDRSDKPPHQFLPDMDDSPKWKNQGGSEFFVDGRTMRPQIEGAVAYGRWDFDPKAYEGQAWTASFASDRADLLREDDGVYRGVDGSGRYLAKMPVAVDAELLRRGEERFGIYCAVCHGYAGDGNGMAGQRWATPPPSWHDPKYSDPKEPDQKGADGFIFFTAMNGVPGPEGNITPNDDDATVMRKLIAKKMPGYSHALSAKDAWAIVAYIRVLQETQRGTMNDVPTEKRAELEAAKAKVPPAPETPSPTNPGAQPAPSVTPAAKGKS